MNEIILAVVIVFGFAILGGVIMLYIGAMNLHNYLENRDRIDRARFNELETKLGRIMNTQFELVGYHLHANLLQRQEEGSKKPAKPKLPKTEPEFKEAGADE
jgi:hypothetical protein